VLNPVERLSAKELGRHPLSLGQDGTRIQMAEIHRFMVTEIIGATGTGKNWFAQLGMIHQDIQGKAGVLVLDPKGAMRLQVAAYARKAGREYQTHVLSLSKPALSGTYNPLLGPDPLRVAERVHQALFQDDRTATDFYRDQALGFLINLFGLFHALRVLPTLDQLRGLAMDQDLLALLLRRAPDCPEARELHTRHVAGMRAAEYRDQFQGLVNKLAALCRSPYAPLLNTTSPSIDLKRVLARGEILYVDLAADLYPSSFSRVSTLLMMDLQDSLNDRYQKPEARACFLYLDEFADMIYPKVRDLVAKARDARVGVTFAHQSLADLKRHGLSIADAVFGTSRNKIIFQLGHPDEARLMAELIGTTEAEREAVQYSLLDAGSPDAEGQARSVTRTKERRFLVHAQQLQDLPKGTAACVLQRTEGRAAFLAPLRPAPADIKPLTDQDLPKPKPGPSLQALDLDLGASKVPEPPTQRPRNVQAREALDLMRKPRRARPQP
jgi:hypothetical protein